MGVQAYYKVMGYKRKDKLDPNLKDDLKAIASATKIKKQKITKQKEERRSRR